MFNSLKTHPFAVQADFDQSQVLTFAVPKELLLPLIPSKFELDTYLNKWGFIAVAMVQTKNLRPKSFPKLFGRNFFLVGYRIFVRFKNKSGKTRRGLYILKSETDSKRIQILGNIFTQYKYATTDVQKSKTDTFEQIFSKKSKFMIKLERGCQEIKLPPNSPFKNWKEARKFAGPLPFTFTYDPKTDKVLVIEGIRKNWKPSPLEVSTYNFEFLTELNLPEVVLANAFEIKNVSYEWKKGRFEYGYS